MPDRAFTTTSEHVNIQGTHRLTTEDVKTKGSLQMQLVLDCYGPV